MRKAPIGVLLIPSLLLSFSACIGLRRQAPRTQSFETHPTSLPANEAMVRLKKAAQKDLGFDIAIEEKDSFATSWLTIPSAALVSEETKYLADFMPVDHVALIVRVDKSKPFSAFWTLTDVNGILAFRTGYTPLEQRVMVAFDDALQSAKKTKDSDQENEE